ncbi:hypothetical protein PsorP6_007363 [Peronosclerospora sorghi]|uniref:Uncharacterized protein n=1 Tax=Peronosclerospora sorghi TaxID=230839 RepID=A0ACC0W9Y0_9STRA|nr:hypothetical protein PsorP6_007363 [Peronosclerospora sorghi]
MEDELIAQRDAAIAVTKELQRQLQTYREDMERTFERRTLNAERMRLHAEEKLRCAIEDRDWSETCYRRVLVLALFLGCGGALIGWLVGLLLLLMLGQPLLGFLLVLPGMALGTLAGLAVAQTKLQFEKRRRNAKFRDSIRHREVDMAVDTGLDEQDAPSESTQSTTNNRKLEHSATSGSLSLLRVGSSAAWFTLQTSKDIAVGLFRGASYLRGILHSTEDKKKK